MNTRKFIFFLSLITIVALFMTSCGKTIIDYLVKAEFHYINNTNQPVKINVYGSITGTTFVTYLIAPNDSIVLSETDQTHLVEADPSSYVPLLQGDSVKVIFLDTLCYKEYRESIAILNNINSYHYEKRGKRDYLFFYRFDSTMQNLAKTCN